jgi:tetratricopeptide (TPR) repeat protein
LTPDWLPGFTIFTFPRLSLHPAQSFSSFLSFNLASSSGRYQECLSELFLLEGPKMRLRRGLLVWCVLSLGCHSLKEVELEPETSRNTGGSPVASRNIGGLPVALWEEGQAAMRAGRPEQAIRCYEQSLAADTSLDCNYLSLAAACLESGKEEAACDHLGKYVACHPEHLTSRGHYAELLFKLKRSGDARVQFERFAADAQEKSDKPARLVYAFSRLMEIALVEGNEYEEHLYRGAGLYLLARRRAELADPDGELPASGLLWKAVFELQAAQDLRPREARPCWYLYSAWWAMGKQQPAQRWLRSALDNALFTPLTPAEQRSLHLAGQCLEKRL